MDLWKTKKKYITHMGCNLNLRFKIGTKLIVYIAKFSLLTGDAEKYVQTKRNLQKIIR